MLTATISAVLFAVCACTAPVARAPAAHGPTILKQEVDDLIDQLRKTADETGRLGDGSCRQTAMVLAAAGHCHRFYYAGDGPWLRRAIEAMFLHRRGDGAFADGSGDDGIATTRWVLAALEVMEPAGYATERDAGRIFLGARGAPTASPMRDQVETMLEDTRSAADQPAALTAAGRSAMPAGDLGRVDPSGVAVALVQLVSCQVAARELGKKAQDPVDAQAWLPTQQKGVDFLMKQQRDGAFGVEREGKFIPDVGLTGLALAALQTKPKAKRSKDEQAAVAKGLAYLLAQQDEKEGSFGKRNVNYSTCAAVMALGAAQDPAHSEVLERAQRYIVGMQNVEGRGYAPDDRDYGSMGYGGDQRGDLSNLHFALEALELSGLEANHEAFAKAIVFLQRTQNLRKYNDFKGKTRSEEDGSFHDVAPGDDGGAAYYPGNSPAGYDKLSDGTLVPRSYGSMTYALLKAYILCGLKRDDPRIKAAVDWIQQNWDLDVNPGVDPALGKAAAYQGLYYYYMVVGQALDVAQVDAIARKDQEKVDWRAALTKHLQSTQRDDGSWVNKENSRWWEDQPLLCTSYALLALARSAREEGKSK